MSIAAPVERHGLTEAEYGLVVAALGREPNPVELGMFGAMWSEHCAYKHSRPLLGSLPTEGERVLVGPGENAGAIDIGDGLAVVFKVESHNHPSAVEPYQGAATGVGGIIRDIFTMGARPIALLNSLRFGPLDPAEDASGRTDAAAATRNRYLLGGVVAGIAGYGNCIGIPDVGGEIGFDATYNGNPLVNAMCVGIARHDEITLARAAGPGNALLLVGASTGRDGIQGASFASATLGEDRDERRPAVQVGNPFLEKLLMEACLELSGSDVGGGDAGPRRGRPDLRPGRGLGARRLRRGGRPRPRPAPRAGHDAVRGAAQRVAGADAARRARRRRGRGAGRLRALRPARGDDRPGHRRAGGARHGRRRSRSARCPAAPSPTTRRATRRPPRRPPTSRSRRAERLDDLAAERPIGRHAARAAGQPERRAAASRSGGATTT